MLSLCVSGSNTIPRKGTFDVLRTHVFPPRLKFAGLIFKKYSQIAHALFTATNCKQKPLVPIASTWKCSVDGDLLSIVGLSLDRVSAKAACKFSCCRSTVRHSAQRWLESRESNPGMSYCSNLVILCLAHRGSVFCVGQHRLASWPSSRSGPGQFRELL